MAIEIREAAEITLVRGRTGAAHVCDPNALEAVTDGRGVFDVDSHCRKLEAFIDQHKLQVGIVCDESLLDGDRPVYFTQGWTRRNRPNPPRRPAAAMR